MERTLLTLEDAHRSRKSRDVGLARPRPSGDSPARLHYRENDRVRLQKKRKGEESVALPLRNRHAPSIPGVGKSSPILMETPDSWPTRGCCTVAQKARSAWAQWYESVCQTTSFARAAHALAKGTETCGRFIGMGAARRPRSFKAGCSIA